MQEDWFENWFDSPYYHLLYNHRNYEEAEFFINNLFTAIELNKKASVLDLACGKGRHAMQINQLGYKVTGIDLSPESIKTANKLANDDLEFQTGDMRNIGIIDRFDLVVNLFTSFGYFQEEGDNVKVIESITKALKPQGRLILDYLNVYKAEKGLPVNEVIERKEINFRIKKEIKNGFIVKDIQFEANEKNYEFKEYVKCFKLEDFKAIFKKCGLEITEVYGNYSLEEFDLENSDRLILIAKKV